MMNEISTLTTIFNEDMSQIERALQSVKQQANTELFVEHVIVIDNPDFEDQIELVKLIRNLTNRFYKVNLIKNEINVGLAKSLNIGLEASSFEWVARLDADDWMNPGRLKEESTMILRDDLDVIYTDTLIYDGENEEPVEIKAYATEGIDKMLPLRNFIAHSSVLMRKSKIESVGMYRNLEPAEDYDLWLRLLNAGASFGYIPKALTSREVRANSISNSNLFRQLQMARYVRKINMVGRLTKGDKEPPKNCLTEKQLHVQNNKIKRFKNAHGLEKLIATFSSPIILLTTINDLHFVMMSKWRK